MIRMLPLAGLVRSSDRVRERQQAGTYHGDEDQVAEITHYCGSRNRDVVFLPPELDVSGGKPIKDRPSLLEGIEGTEQGRYSGIVTANLKRLTRSRSGIEIWDRVEAAGGQVHCAAENLDTSTPNGRFVRDIHLAEAVREREEHADRHDRRRQKTVEAGIWRNWQLPRGYAFKGPEVDGRCRGAARRLVPGPDADEIVQAFRDRVAGRPLQEIASRLRMTRRGLVLLLANRAYLGELRDGPYVNPAAHEPLIDEDTFIAANNMRSTRPARRCRYPALLAGLARCAGCGHLMSRTASNVPVYACAGFHSEGPCPARATVTLARLDEHVVEIALAALRRMQANPSVNDTEIRQARAALSRAERELAAYLEAVSAADIGAEAFAAGARRRRANIDVATRRLAAALHAVQPVKVEGDPRLLWRKLDDGQRNRLLRGIFETVLVERSGGRGVYRPLEDRVRAIAFGAGLLEPHPGGGVPLPVRTIPLPDRDDPVVVGVDL